MDFAEDIDKTDQLTGRGMVLRCPLFNPPPHSSSTGGCPETGANGYFAVHLATALHFGHRVNPGLKVCDTYPWPNGSGLNLSLHIWPLSE
jgi:hypothetical protein